MSVNWRRWLGYSLVLSAVTTMGVVWATFEPETLSNLGVLEPRFLALALAMYFAAILVEGCRIAVIAAAMGRPMKWRQGCSLFLTTSFAGLATPMGMGELPMLVLCYTQHGFKLGMAVAAAMVRSFGTKMAFLAGMIWLFVIGRQKIGFGPVTDDIFSLVALVLVTSTAINALYILFPGLFHQLVGRLPGWCRRGWLGRWQKRLDSEAWEFDRGLKQIWQYRPLVLVVVGLLALIYWSLYLALAAVLARGLGISVEPMVIFSRQFLLILALPYIPVPGGSGAIELAMVAMYAGLVPRTLLGIFVLSWRAITYYLQLGLGALMAMGRFWRLG